ncbi:MAG: helix-turn-helix transcriptional regulator [Rhizomicrobium sp.]
MTAPFPGRGTLSVTVAPLQPDGLPMVTSDASALVTIVDAQPNEAAMSGKLVALFALTPAEVRIALALLRGATPRQTANTFGVSVNTVRSQLASIFGKTETANQPELPA